MSSSSNILIPTFVQKYICILLWNSYKKIGDRLVLRLVSKNWRQFIDVLYSRNNTTRFEYYLDTETYPPTFQNDLLNPFNPLGHIYKLNIQQLPSNNKYDRISKQQTPLSILQQEYNNNNIDNNNQDQLTVESLQHQLKLKTYSKLKLLVFNSHLLSLPSFKETIKDIIDIQSNHSSKHCLNKLLIYVNTPVTDDNLSILHPLLPFISKLSLISENWFRTDDKEYTNYLTLFNHLPKLRKLVIDIHPPLISTLCQQYASVLTNLERLSIQTKFMKEEDFPWQQLNKLKQLNWLSSSFLFESDQFLRFLLENQTIKVINSTLPMVDHMLYNLEKCKNLTDITLRAVERFTNHSNSDTSTQFTLPPHLINLTMVIETGNTLFRRLMQSLHDNQSVENLSIAKQVERMSIADLGFMLRRNRSIRHLTFTNLYGNSPDCIDDLINGLALNQTLESLTFYSNFTIAHFNQLFKILVEHSTTLVRLQKIIVNRKSLPQKYKFDPQLLSLYLIDVGSDVVSIYKR